MPALVEQVSQPTLKEPKSAITVDKSNPLESFSRQTAVIPNLCHLFPHWAWDGNPVIDAINDDIDAWLPTVEIVDSIKRKHRLKGNYALSTVGYYANASYEKVLLLTKFQYWIFIWDDEIDPGGQLASDSRATEICCRQTKECFDRCLSSEEGFGKGPKPTDAPGQVTMLYPILMEMRKEMSTTSIQRMHRDLHEFVDGVLRQQEMRLKVSSLPSPLGLLNMRAKDIGVNPCITQAEYAMNFTLPQLIYKSPALQELLQLCSELVVLVNEIVSFQKEARDGQVENITLLLAMPDGATLQQGVDTSMQMIRERVAYFALVEERLKREFPSSSLEINEYIIAARALVTGTVWWSYESGRYFTPSQRDHDWNVTVQL